MKHYATIIVGEDGTGVIQIFPYVEGQSIEKAKEFIQSTTYSIAAIASAMSGRKLFMIEFEQVVK